MNSNNINFKIIFKYIIFAFIPPIALIILLVISNIISNIFSININPTGVNNSIWIAFWGSYLGGICTLIALYFTFKQNQKNLEETITENHKSLEKTIIENRKQLEFQQEMKNIEKEKEHLSNLISNLYPTSLIKFMTDFINARTDFEDYRKEQTYRILDDIAIAQKTLLINDTKLKTISSINNNCYKSCKNFNKCKLAIRKKDFFELYNKVSDTLFKSYSNMINLINSENDYVAAKKINSKSTKWEDFDIELLNQSKYIVDNHNENYQALSQTVHNDIKILLIIQIRDIDILVNHINLFIEEREKLALDELYGKKVLKQVIDNKKHSDWHKEYLDSLKKRYESINNPVL